MKACRGTFCCVAITAAIGLVTSMVIANPPGLPKGGTQIQGAHKVRAFEVSPNTGGTSAPSLLCETTGFEAGEAMCEWEAGFGICGSTFICQVPPYATTCTAPVGPPEPDNCCVTKPNPNTGWFMSASAQHCERPSISAGTGVGGTNSMRFERSTLGGNPAGCTGLTSTCRESAFTPNVNPSFPVVFNPAVTTTSFDVARDAPLGNPGMQINWTNQSNSEGYIAQWIRFDKYGYVDARDFFLSGYSNLGGLDADGYHNVTTVYDQCGNEQRYYFDGVLKYTMEWNGIQSIEQEVWLGDNVGGAIFDFDNFSVSRVFQAGPTCPSVCGDAILTVGEACDNSVVPDGDACCPGRCIDAGMPDECTCTPPTNTIFDCSARALDNGVNGPFLSDGGFYSYVADAPFTSVDTCDADFDTEILWNISADCSTFEAFNDECVDGTFGGYQTAGDPNAACYVAPNGCTAGNPVCPGSSCLCVPTMAGQTYTFLVDQYYMTLQPPLCSSVVVNITKKTNCNLGGPIPGGACCNTLTGACTDGVDAQACAGPDDVYSLNKNCDIVTCEARLGACCNTAPGSGGACTETAMADCPASQYQTWTDGATCNEVHCAEVTGSCCDPISGSCSTGVIQGDCTGTWTEGGTCSTCFAAIGACCVDDGLQTAACTDGATLAQCSTSGGVWTNGVACADLADPCQSDFTAIPTVSEWGLAVLALMLLIGGKIYFSRREASMA